MQPIQSKPTQIGHGLVIMPIQHQCSSNVLNWNSCQLSQWRANAAIIRQCPEINTQWGANQTQLNLTARRQVWGLTFCDLCKQVGRESQSSTIYANLCQSITNWKPICCQLKFGIVHSKKQSAVTLLSIWCQLTSNVTPIECQYNANL